MQPPPGLRSASPAPRRTALGTPRAPAERSALLKRLDDFGAKLDASFQDQILGADSASFPRQPHTPSPPLPLATPGSWRGDWIVTPRAVEPPPGLHVTAPTALTAPPGLAPPAPPGLASSRAQQGFVQAQAQAEELQKDHAWAQQDLAEAQDAARAAAHEHASAVAWAQKKEQEMLRARNAAGWAQPLADAITKPTTPTDARQARAQRERSRRQRRRSDGRRALNCVVAATRRGQSCA